jgi:hypothetical protein
LFAQAQGCQIFLDTIYQNGENNQLATKLPNGHTLYLMAIIHSIRPKNIPIYYIQRLSKIYPDWDFWFKNIPSGNPAHAINGHFQLKKKTL